MFGDKKSREVREVMRGRWKRGGLGNGRGGSYLVSCVAGDGADGGLNSAGGGIDVRLKS